MIGGSELLNRISTLLQISSHFMEGNRSYLWHGVVMFEFDIISAAFIVVH